MTEIRTQQPKEQPSHTPEGLEATPRKRKPLPETVELPPINEAPITEELARIQDEQIDAALSEVMDIPEVYNVSPEKVAEVRAVLQSLQKALVDESSRGLHSFAQKFFGRTKESPVHGLKHKLSTSTEGGFSTEELLATIDQVLYEGDMQSLKAILDHNPTNKQIILKVLKEAGNKIPRTILEQWANDPQILAIIQQKIASGNMFHEWLPEVIRTHKDISPTVNSIILKERAKKYQRRSMETNSLDPNIKQTLEMLEGKPFDEQIVLISQLPSDIISTPRFFETLATRIGDQEDLNEARALVVNASETNDTNKITAAVDIFNNLRIDRALELAEQTGHADVSKHISEQRLAA